MNQIHTEREQVFINLAARLADDFAERAAQHDEDTWVIVLRPDREPQAGHDQMCLYDTLCRWGGVRRRGRYRAGSRCQRAYVRHCIPYLLLGKLVPKSRHGGG